MIIIPTNATAKKPLAWKDAAGAHGTSVSIPAHNAGDLIVLYVQQGYSSTVTKPSASGTVPTWNTILLGPGTYERAQTHYAVATSSSTTTGDWTGAHLVVAMVIEGQGASPIGARASYSNYGEVSLPAPAVTLQKTDGTSLLIHVGGTESYYGYFNAAFSSSGYTARLAPTGPGASYRVVTKDVTTTDGLMYLGSLSGGYDYASQTIEILA